MPLVGVGCMYYTGAAYFGWRILVALDLSQCIVCCIEDELRRVVAKETLAHVHDGLHWRSLRGLIDDRPDILDQSGSASPNGELVSEQNYSPNILPLTGNSGGGLEGFFHHACSGECSQSSDLVFEDVSRESKGPCSGIGGGKQSV